MKNVFVLLYQIHSSRGGRIHSIIVGIDLRNLDLPPGPLQGGVPLKYLVDRDPRDPSPFYRGRLKNRSLFLLRAPCLDNLDASWEEVRILGNDWSRNSCYTPASTHNHCSRGYTILQTA